MAHYLERANIKDKEHILNVANIEPRKNQQMLLRAMKECPELKLINIGQCRDKEYYQECKREGGSVFYFWETRICFRDP